MSAEVGQARKRLRLRAEGSRGNGLRGLWLSGNGRGRVHNSPQLTTRAGGLSSGRTGAGLDAGLEFAREFPLNRAL
jgi:hypothetical protein